VLKNPQRFEGLICRRVWVEWGEREKTFVVDPIEAASHSPWKPNKI